MIELIGINKYYPIGRERFHALKNVDLKVEQGDFIAIQGRSGSGKSTLLNIIGCLDDYDSGSYILDGQEIYTLNDDKMANLRNQHIGFVLQDFLLLNQKTVLFNVMLPLLFSKVPYREVKRKAMEAIEKVGINGQTKKMVRQLSGGQKQRVAIARAIVNNPSILLADEPTGALDSETARHVMELLVEMNQRGQTILIVTHDDAISAYCKKRIYISDGVIDTSM